MKRIFFLMALQATHANAQVNIHPTAHDNDLKLSALPYYSNRDDVAQHFVPAQYPISNAEPRHLY